MYELDLVCFEAPFRFSLRAMRRFAGAAGAIVLAGEEDGRLVGFVIVDVEQDRGYVSTVDVRPGYRRGGVASKLLRLAEVEAASRGVTRMELHVYSGNAGAIRFYERLGYAKVGVETDYYGAGSDAIRYVGRVVPPGRLG